MTDELELISIYYGEDVAEDAANALRTKVEEAYPSCDVELQFGGQPILLLYYFGGIVTGKVFEYKKGGETVLFVWNEM